MQQCMMPVHVMGSTDVVCLRSKMVGKEKGHFFADASVLVDHNAGPPFFKSCAPVTVQGAVGCRIVDPCGTGSNFRVGIRSSVVIVYRRSGEGGNRVQ